jgi:uncharacterized protein (DUF2147 family)
MKYIFPFLFFFSVSSHLTAQNPDDVLGIWKHPDGNLLVKIDRIGNTYQGRITWLDQSSDPAGKPALDVHNPDPRLRKIPLKGNRIFQKLIYNSSTDTWENGLYYVFSEGKTYPCKIVLLDAERIKISKLAPDGTLVEEEIWSRYQ